MKANRLPSALLFLLTATFFQQCEEKTETVRKQGDELRAKAEAGDANSQYQLALRYYKGEGVTKELTEAARWYRKAAEQ
jgi:TPR repeat protein